MLIAESNTELKISKVEALASMLCLFFQPRLLASGFENLEAEAIVGCCPGSAAGTHKLCCHCAPWVSGCIESCLQAVRWYHILEAAVNPWQENPS